MILKFDSQVQYYYYFCGKLYTQKWTMNLWTKDQSRFFLYQMFTPINEEVYVVCLPCKIWKSTIGISNKWSTVRLLLLLLLHYFVIQYEYLCWNTFIKSSHLCPIAFVISFNKPLNSCRFVPLFFEIKFHEKKETVYV